MGFHDDLVLESGTHESQSLGVRLRALSWHDERYEDAVVLQYVVSNGGATSHHDVYLGLWMDTTVGNTESTSPYPGSSTPWNYYDDVNGALRPGEAPATPGFG